MPASNAKPHVSRALSHLRYGVTGAGIGVAVTTFLQLIVFGFVHFTDVRFTDLKPVQDKQRLSVISSSSMGPSFAPPDEALPPLTPADVNRVRTGWDVGLDRLNGLAVVVGVVSATTLCLMCMLGVVVAGGGAVPGVERAVTATTWAVVLAVLCLPIGSILNSTSIFPGVYGSYGLMVAASGSVNAGQGSNAALFATYVLMPFAALAAALVIVLRFRSGIEMGVIPESLSEFDEMLEKEMATIRKRGVSAAGGRAGTAMQQTMREAPESQPQQPVATQAKTMAERAPRAVDEAMEAPTRKPSRAWVSSHDRKIGDVNPGDPLKRPI